jgi:hypothetical protein
MGNSPLTRSQVSNLHINQSIGLPSLSKIVFNYLNPIDCVVCDKYFGRLHSKLCSGFSYKDTLDIRRFDWVSYCIIVKQDIVYIYVYSDIGVLKSGFWEQVSVENFARQILHKRSLLHISKSLDVDHHVDYQPLHGTTKERRAHIALQEKVMKFLLS